MFDLIIVRMRGAIGGQQAVYHKSPVIWHIAKIASIGPEFTVLKFQAAAFVFERRAVNGFGNTLIHPVPDSCSGNAGIGIYYIPILRKITA